MIHMIIVQAAMNAGSGIRAPGSARLNQATFRNRSAATTHVPSTRNVAPK